jgi:hypothetical protein
MSTKFCSLLKPAQDAMRETISKYCMLRPVNKCLSSFLRRSSVKFTSNNVTICRYVKQKNACIFSLGEQWRSLKSTYQAVLQIHGCKCHLGFYMNLCLENHFINVYRLYNSKICPYINMYVYTRA